MTEMVSHLTLFTVLHAEGKKSQQVLASSIESAMDMFHKAHPDDHIYSVLVGDQTVHYGETDATTEFESA